MPSAVTHGHPHGRHVRESGPTAASGGAVATPAQPGVGLVYRDGAEVVLQRDDERVAELVAVADVLAEGTPTRDGTDVAADVSEGTALTAQPRPSAAHPEPPAVGRRPATVRRRPATGLVEPSAARRAFAPRRRGHRRRAAWHRLVAAVRRLLQGGRR